MWHRRRSAWWGCWRSWQLWGRLRDRSPWWSPCLWQRPQSQRTLMVCLFLLIQRVIMINRHNTKYCTILYRTVLYCTVLYYSILYYTVLWYIALYNINSLWYPVLVPQIDGGLTPVCPATDLKWKDYLWKFFTFKITNGFSLSHLWVCHHIMKP